MRDKSKRLTASCALLFATFPLLYYAAAVSREPAMTYLALALLTVGVVLALST